MMTDQMSALSSCQGTLGASCLARRRRVGGGSSSSSVPAPGRRSRPRPSRDQAATAGIAGAERPSEVRRYLVPQRSLPKYVGAESPSEVPGTLPQRRDRQRKVCAIAKVKERRSFRSAENEFALLRTNLAAPARLQETPPRTTTTS